jgi:hypothetical protein
MQSPSSPRVRPVPRLASSASAPTRPAPAARKHSKLEPAGFRSYFGGRSASNARSTVPRETPSCLASSLLEIFSVAYRWRIGAQTSNVITFHNGQWPHFQLAFLALFSVGVNT